MSLITALDSEATFVQRAQECGLGSEWIDSLKLQNLATFAKLSFAVTSPGQPATDDQVNGFLRGLRPGVPATIADQSAMKRLFFEAQALMVQSTRTSVRGDDAGSVKVPQAEREARLNRQKQQLRGIDISGPLEPAHALYDLCFQMLELNEVMYISPNKCLSRQQEITGSKPEKEIQLDSTKTGLVVKEQSSHAEVNISSDLLLYQAIQRRSLAMDLANLASYEVMRKWTDRLFAMYSQSPAPGFSKITSAQLLRADRQAFVRISEQFTGSVRNYVGPGKPLDDLIDRLEYDMTVTYYMLPHPQSQQSHGGSASASGSKSDDGKRKPTIQNTGSPKKNRYQNQQKGGAKGSGKARNKQKDPMPAALQGMHSRTPKGEPICFAYNLGNCKLGSKCTRQHVCCVPGCYKEHPHIEHQ